MTQRIRTLVVAFEDDFALRGLPYLEKELPEYKAAGLLARKIPQEVYEEFPDLPIYEKNLDQDYLIKLNSTLKISQSLFEYLSDFEEHIHYHINRYFDTGKAYDYSLIKCKLILHVLEILHRTKAEHIFYAITPHDPVSYLLYLVGKFQKVDISIILRHGKLFHFTLYDTIGDQLGFVRKGFDETDSDRIARKEAHVVNALDQLSQYEPSDIKGHSKKSGNIVNKILHNLFVRKKISYGTKGFVRYLKRRRFKKAYEGMVTINTAGDINAIDKKIIYFALHVQPELTTSPDGGKFAQQWKAIKALYDEFGDECAIIIKEHPVQFMFNTSIVRTPIFYEALKAIGPNVHLTNLQLSSRDILTHTDGVATITGTIGLESLLNEIPVLFFGDTKIDKIAGAYNFNKGEMSGFSDALMNDTGFKKDQVYSDFKALTRSRFYYCYDPNEDHESLHMDVAKVLLKEYYSWRYQS